MSIGTILLLLFFVGMMAMHLRGHGGHGHGGGHGDSPPRRDPAELERPETADRVTHHTHDAPT